MAITKKAIARELRDLSIFFLVSLLQSYLTCSTCNTLERFSRTLLFTFLMWIILWKGNTFVTESLCAKIPWFPHPLKRFLIGIVLTIAFTIFAVVTLIEIFEYSYDIQLGKEYLYTLYGSIGITILISLFLHARSFLLSWRKASLEKEAFEKESIVARYETLKNQVSPHFLFNSLNALTNLVYEDPEKAVRFIKHLSEVYRYVLETREKEVVPLSEELTFLDSYLYLQRVRFGKKLFVDIEVNSNGIQVAPLALQMLIENAIKHNVISEEDPLAIRLYKEDAFLVVENNLQKKTVVNNGTASGLGLENIRKRYEFLSNTKVQIIEDKSRFMVKLPVL